MPALTSCRQAYDNDIVTLATLSIQVARLRERAERWAGRLIHEPPSVGDALNHLADAQRALDKAITSVEDMRAG